MANALQFIESNIEDLDREDIQKVIAKRFIEKINEEKEKYPKIGQLSELYSEDSSDSKHFNFEEMRLVEEVLI